MNGILIYSKKEAEKNSFVVNKMVSELGVCLVDEHYRGKADFVINRTNDFKIAEYYEKQGVRVFNPAKFSRLANDKGLCYDYMQKNKIEIMPTRYRAVPAVKKPVNGHGGKGVQIISVPQDFEDGFVYQKPCNNLGRDLRVWIIGTQITASILRVSKTDFRSNYSLGGEAIPYTLSTDEIKQIKKIISLISGDYYGVDFIFNDNHIVFNELEDTVGARMVYEKTDIDIIHLYCNYIKENI